MRPNYEELDREHSTYVIVHSNGMVENQNGWTENPIIYDDGKIGFDSPERFTLDERDFIRKSLLQIRKFRN